MLTTLVENWPGHRDGIMGPELMAEMRAQAERFGAEIIQGNVTSGRPQRAAVRRRSRRRPSITAAHADHRDRRVGAAARPAVGARADGPRRLDLRDLRRLLLPRQADRGRRRRRHGDGRGALPDALRLARSRSIHRRDTLRASKIMQDKALAQPEDRTGAGTATSSASTTTGKGEVTAIVLRDLVTGETTELPVDGVFVAIGHTPNTALFSGQLETRRERLHRSRTTARRRACPACSRAATCRTTSIARRSPPPAQAAWRRSTREHYLEQHFPATHHPDGALDEKAVRQSSRRR